MKLLLNTIVLLACNSFTAIALLSIASLAYGMSEPCDAAYNVQCSGNSPSACVFTFGTTFACCNTYGNTCCARRCGTVSCTPNPEIEDAVCSVVGSGLAYTPGTSSIGMCTAAGTCRGEVEP